MGADYYVCVDLYIESRRPGEMDTAVKCIQVSKSPGYFFFDDDDDDDYEDEKSKLPTANPNKLIWEDGQFYVKNEAKYIEYVDAHTVRIYKVYYSYLRL
jgi:hypothetical protein